jgi:hypothetical protein
MALTLPDQTPLPIGMMRALNLAQPVRDPGCKGIAPRPLRAVAGASIAPPPNLREPIRIVPGTPQFNHSTRPSLYA